MEQLVIEKIVLPISECMPGMVLMQSIMEENTGMVIVARGQVLTEESIEKLKKFNHTGVWVSMQPENSVWQVNHEVFKTYQSYAKCLKGIMNGKQISPQLMRELGKLTQNIILEFLDEYQILSCVHLSYQLEQDIYEHSLNVAFLSLLMGRWNGYKEERLKDLVLSALLHDVGKADLEPSITCKAEGSMSLTEKIEFRRHPVYGYEKLLSCEEVNLEVLKGVLSHHERCDGSGYPLSLKDTKINDFAKIIAIADTYEYLKKENHIFKVIHTLESIMLRKFEVNLLLPFCRNLAGYYVGASVLLNSGEVGEVLFIQSQAAGRPLIRVKDTIINLYEKVQLDIIKVL